MQEKIQKFVQCREVEKEKVIKTLVESVRLFMKNTPMIFILTTLLGLTKKKSNLPDITMDYWNSFVIVSMNWSNKKGKKVEPMFIRIPIDLLDSPHFLRIIHKIGYK